MPAISFKSDILAAKVNITNMDNEAFFNILDIPFELLDTELLDMLTKMPKN